jgi:hypothetical protein
MKRYLIHWFPFCSGGLCDRILGLASSICIAKILNMDLLIKWDHCDLSSGFKINEKYNWYNNQVSYRFINLTNIESVMYFKNTDIVKEWGEYNILLWSNLNLYNYLLENTHFLKYKTTNYVQNLSNSIKLVLNDIFIINKQVLSKLKLYDVGIHIRTGDKQIYNKDNEEFYRDYIINILNNIKNMQNDTTGTLFISSDCLLTYKIAKDVFGDIYYNEGCIIHTSEEDKINEEGLNKVLLDLLTLCNCKEKLYIGWNSNFSRIASLYNTDRIFICYEYENIPNTIKECSNETLFSYLSNGKYT